MDSPQAGAPSEDFPPLVAALSSLLNLYILEVFALFEYTCFGASSSSLVQVLVLVDPIRARYNFL